MWIVGVARLDHNAQLLEVYALINGTLEIGAKMASARNDSGEKKMDRRTRKTLAAIRGAFMGLLEEKSLEKITVTEIAQRADVDRKTFYLHYDSIEALVDELLHVEIERIVGTLNESTITDNGTIDIQQLFRVLSAGLAADFGDKVAVIAHTDASVILDRIEPMLASAIVENDSLQLAEHLGPYLDIFVSYFYGGLLALYRKWIEENSELPLEDLSAMAGAAIAGGVGSLVEVSKEYVDPRS